jgi:hypothetical protein
MRFNWTVRIFSFRLTRELNEKPMSAVVAFSTAPGTDGANRPYTATLMQALKGPGLSVIDAFGLVRVATFEASNGVQCPWETSKLTAGFSMFPGSTPTSAPDLAIKSAEFWQNEIHSRQPVDAFRFVVSQNATSGYQELLRAYPNSNYAAQIRALLVRRQEMLAWHDAVKDNSVAAFQTFLAIYPQSDFVVTTQRLLARAHANAGTSAPAPMLPSTPAVAPAASISTPDSAAKKIEREAEPEPKKKKARADSDDEDRPKKKKARANSDDDDQPRRRRHTVRRHATSTDAPQTQPRSEPPVSLGPVGIGIGGFSIGIGR